MADVVNFDKKPEPNIYITPEMQSLVLEVMYGMYDIAMVTAKTPLEPELAARAADTLKYVCNRVREDDPEHIIDLLLTLTKPKAVGSDARYLSMYNEMLRIKKLFVQERKNTLN